MLQLVQVHKVFGQFFAYIFNVTIEVQLFIKCYPKELFFSDCSIEDKPIFTEMPGVLFPNNIKLRFASFSFIWLSINQLERRLVSASSLY